MVGHAGQPVTEASGGQPGNRAPERPTALAPAQRLAASRTRIGEAEVLDRETGAAVLVGEADDVADRLTQASVAL
ncbi:hypothetical protein [Streptomyces sp. NPDC058401]|uniref:hypothetical protein n=1 Tax=Streptomyces sp. NPDC058401 TaxID=3346480 RepID=UPI003646B20A